MDKINLDREMDGAYNKNWRDDVYKILASKP
jgi:hypothetical protein